MSKNREERSAANALGLMAGWAWIMIGLGIPIFGSLREWKSALIPIAIGAACIGFVLWSERRERSGRKLDVASVMTGGTWILLGIVSIGFRSERKEWKAALACMAFGVVWIIPVLWRKRSAQKPEPLHKNPGGS